MLDGVEFGEASEHDNGARFSIVSGPAAEAREDPGGEGERAFGMGIFCFAVLPSRLKQTRSRTG